MILIKDKIFQPTILAEPLNLSQNQLQMATSSNIGQITIIVNVQAGYELIQLRKALTPPRNPTALMLHPKVYINSTQTGTLQPRCKAIMTRPLRPLYVVVTPVAPLNSSMQ